MPGFRLGFIIVPEKRATSVLGGKLADISNSGLNQKVFQYFLEKEYGKNILKDQEKSSKENNCICIID